MASQRALLMRDINGSIVIVKGIDGTKIEYSIHLSHTGDRT
jgi:hypothetical protein